MYLIFNLKVNISTIALQVKLMIGVELKLIKFVSNSGIVEVEVQFSPNITNCTYQMLTTLVLFFWNF